VQQEVTGKTPDDLTVEDWYSIRNRATRSAFRLIEIWKKEHLSVTEEELLRIATESGTKDIINESGLFTRPGPSMREYLKMFSQIWRDTGMIASQEELLQQTSQRLAYETLSTLNKEQRKITEDMVLPLATETGVTAQLSQTPSLYGDPEEAMRKHIEIFMRILREGNVIVSLLVCDAREKAQEQKRRDAQFKSPVSEFVLITQAKTLALLSVVSAAIATASSSTTVEHYQLTEEDQTKQKQYVDAYITAYTVYQAPEPVSPPSPRKKFLGIF